MFLTKIALQNKNACTAPHRELCRHFFCATRTPLGLPCCSYRSVYLFGIPEFRERYHLVYSPVMIDFFLSFQCSHNFSNAGVCFYYTTDAVPICYFHYVLQLCFQFLHTISPSLVDYIISKLSQRQNG